MTLARRRVHWYLSLLNCPTPSMKKTYIKMKNWQSLSIILSATSTWNCGVNELRNPSSLPMARLGEPLYVCHRGWAGDCCALRMHSQLMLVYFFTYGACPPRGYKLAQNKILLICNSQLELLRLGHPKSPHLQVSHLYLRQCQCSKWLFVADLSVNIKESNNDF